MDPDWSNQEAMTLNYEKIFDTGAAMTAFHGNNDNSSINSQVISLSMQITFKGYEYTRKTFWPFCKWGNFCDFQFAF